MAVTLIPERTIEEQSEFVRGLPGGTEVMFRMGGDLVVEKVSEAALTTLAAEQIAASLDQIMASIKKPRKCYLGGQMIGELKGYAADHRLYGGTWYCVTIGVAEEL